MQLPWLIVVSALVACVAGSFFFALAESALFSLGQWRARALADSNPVRGAVVLRLLARADDLLASIVLGNALSNALLVAVTLLLAIQQAWKLSIVIPVLLTGLILLCEVTPKALAVRRPDLWALRVARPMEWMVWLTHPVRRIAQRVVDTVLFLLVPKSISPLAGVSGEEYSDLIEMAHQQGTLGTREKEIILQILSLDRRTARDVMKRRAQMIALPDDLPPAQMVEAARKSGHHRLPLFDETPDTIVGVLNTRTLLLNPEVDLAEAIEFPSFVPESMNLLKLFEALQRQQRGVAIVLDEFGGTAGLVTVEDILESVIGEIRAEGEAEGFLIEKLAPGRWRANGAMRLDDFRREHPALGDDPDVDTLGGLVTKLAEVVPAPGEVFTHRGLRFTVKATDERRVREVLVEIADGKGGLRT